MRLSPAEQVTAFQSTPLVDAIRSAMSVEKRWLFEFLHNRSEQRIDRILRVEMNDETHYRLRHWGYAYGLNAALREQKGPMRLDGVDFYVVHELPEPGWRVVNPFRDARAA